MSDEQKAAETLRDVAKMLDGMALAFETDDAIMGAICGQGLANHLPALPKHIRDVLMGYLSDEDAAGLRADALYHDSLSMDA